MWFFILKLLSADSKQDLVGVNLKQCSPSLTLRVRITNKGNEG